jgi:hypothetical protein
MLCFCSTLLTGTASLPLILHVRIPVLDNKACHETWRNDCRGRKVTIVFPHRFEMQNWAILPATSNSAFGILPATSIASLTSVPSPTSTWSGAIYQASRPVRVSSTQTLLISISHLIPPRATRHTIQKHPHGVQPTTTQRHTTLNGCRRRFVVVKNSRRHVEHDPRSPFQLPLRILNLRKPIESAGRIAVSLYEIPRGRSGESGSSLGAVVRHAILCAGTWEEVDVKSERVGF